MTYCGKRPGNSHLPAATARVNMNLLKGALQLSKRHWINKTAFVKRVSVTQKHTLRPQGAIEANDNSNEWVFYVLLTARTYGDMDLGLKSNMKGLRSLGSNSWPRLTRREALPLHHRAADIFPCPATALTSSKYHDSVYKLISFKKISQIVFKLQSGQKKKKKKISEITKIFSVFKGP